MEKKCDHAFTCSHHSDAACVSNVPIFNHLEAQQMNEIMTTTQSVSYKRGE